MLFRSANGKDPDTGVDPGEKEVPVEKEGASLFIEKTAGESEGAAFAAGEEVSYVIRIVNNGNVTLKNVTVTDSLTGDAWTERSLAPNEEKVYTATYTVTEADVINGKVTNTATVQAEDPDGNPIEESAARTIATERAAGHMTLQKETVSVPANGSGYALGETITYRITAANDGNLTLTDITVTDTLTGESWTVESLAPGKSETFETSYTVTEADLLAGKVDRKSVV